MSLVIILLHDMTYMTGEGERQISIVSVSVGAALLFDHSKEILG